MKRSNYKICEPLNFNLIGNSNLTFDISQFVSYLIEKGYHVKSYNLFSIFHKFTKSIIFAYSEQLKKLQHHGWLTLINSTHKTN